MAMNATARLTWYPGTVLPYASLWHTLRRVAALNRLQLIDLRRLALGARAWRSPLPDLLHNEGDAIDTQALERLLGETPQALAWSHVGQAAPWMRLLFTPGLRICPACLAAGYHSALLSLRLLGACPIHGLPLRSHCHCGRGFSARFAAQDWLCAGSCPCGALAFFTPQTCRRPTLRACATTALEPVVRWLQQCAAVLTLRQPDAADQQGDDATWSRCAAQWCRALGIDYPACFLQPPGQAAYTAVVWHRRPSPAMASTRSASPPQPRTSAQTADVVVYRAMARHLRRHVVGRSERWVARFRQSGNLLDIARLLAGQPRAVLSLAEVLWARQVEENVEQRRWPYRSVAGPDPIWLRRERLVLDHASQSRPACARLDDSSRQWLEYHAAALTLSTLWGQALSRAVMAARTGVADWGLNCCGLSQLCAGAAAIDPDGRLRFVAIAASGTVMRVPPRPDKAQRRRAATEEPLNRLLRACQGPCMTWSARDGWRVAPSRIPGDGAFRRHRLLGIAAVRPHFWLFTAGGDIVARHCTVAMQALGGTPRQAIEALRAGVRHHVRLYGRVGHEARLHAVPVTPEPVEHLGTRRLREQIQLIREHGRYWSCGDWPTAVRYLDEAGLRIGQARAATPDADPLFTWVDEALRRATQRHARTPT
jgi:hypothetical protein